MSDVDSRALLGWPRIDDALGEPNTACQGTAGRRGWPLPPLPASLSLAGDADGLTEPRRRELEGLGREGGRRRPAMVLGARSLPPVGGDVAEATVHQFANRFVREVEGIKGIVSACLILEWLSPELAMVMIKLHNTIVLLPDPS